MDDSNLEAWGLDSHPPGDFLGFFTNTSSHKQTVENGTSSQPIKVGDDTNGDNCARTEKRLLWTKEEDLRLEERAIKKKVAWFCASWKEANALYASGESDVDLKKRAMQTYEADHKEDGPFMFEHCWEQLKEQPKWDAYLERLEDLEPEKRKFSVDDEVGKHFTLDDARDERPPGGKQVKEQRKQKRKSESCIIDLEVAEGC